METLDRLEALVRMVEQAGLRVHGISISRAPFNKTIQWMAVAVVLGLDQFGSKELNGYGTTGGFALSNLEREVEKLLSGRTSHLTAQP